MASYNELNALIDAYINRNGVQAITGQILNGVLKAMVEQLGRGYTIMGAAIPTTDPGTPDGPECYFASETGTYTDFDGLQVAPGELALLCYTPSDGWTKETIYEGFQAVQATIDGNVGTPSVGVSYAGGVLSFDFRNMKGNPGDAAGFGTIDANITGGVGTPGVTVESSGPATAKNLQFHFTNLKGETGVTSVVATVDNTTGTPACTVSLVGQQLTLAFSGLKGAQGNTGSSVDYPFTIVNNLTTDDATQALSAAQGVVLEGEITQLEAKVTMLEPTFFGDSDKQNGRYNTDGDTIVESPSTAVWQIIDSSAKADDVYTIVGSGSVSYHLWAFADGQGNILAKSGQSVSATSPIRIIAPKNTALAVFSSYKSGNPAFMVVKNAVFDKDHILVDDLSVKMWSLAKNQIPITQDGAYIPTNGTTIGSPTSAPSYYYSKIPVTPGDKVIVNGTGGSAPRLWCFAKSNGEIISCSGASITGVNLELIAPENAAICVINTNDKTAVSYYIAKESVPALWDFVRGLTYEFTKFPDVTLMEDIGNAYDGTGEYIGAKEYVGGGVISAVDDALEGDVYKIKGYGASSYRLYVFTDDSGKILMRADANLDWSDSVHTITAPQGTKKAYFAYFSSQSHTAPVRERLGEITELKNDVEALKQESAIESPLKGKSLYFCGDSIMLGSLVAENERLYNRIAEKSGGVPTNVSQNGSLFYNDTWYVGASRSILHQVETIPASADYIIVQGGANGVNMDDPTAQNYAPLGQITDSYESVFDTTTQVGCLEEICRYLTRQFVGKKIGFIITYQFGSFAYNRDYWEMKLAAFIPVLKKWGIPVLDWRESGVNLAANSQYYGFDSYGQYPEFDPTASYEADDRVVHDSKLYKANEAISPGAWDASKWTQISTTRYDTWHCNAVAYSILADKTMSWMESL